MFTAGLTGFATAFALILAIGAQNAFILRQGLARQHVFWLCLLCAVSDAILIIAGVLGFGVIVATFPSFPTVMAWAGAAFLFVYGLMRFAAALKGDYGVELSGQSTGLWPTLLTALAITWLNPHVYLDTLGLIGAVSTDFDYGAPRMAFAIGAVSSSFIFFFSLGYGARYLAPLFQSARAWRVLDVIIGIVMWLIALKLIS